MSAMSTTGRVFVAVLAVAILLTAVLIVINASALHLTPMGPDI
jgi:hypothetical protein